MANFRVRQLYDGDRTLISIKQKAGWAPESVWTCWRTEKLLPSMGFEARIVQNHNLIIIPTKLSQTLVRCGYKGITKSTFLGLESRSFRVIGEWKGWAVFSVPHIYEIKIYFG